MDKEERLSERERRALYINSVILNCLTVFNMDRLIASIVVLFVYLLAMYPIPTIVTSVAILIAYLILRNIGSGRHGEYSVADNGKEFRRRKALNEAKMYLAPYKDIWRYLKLSNKYCVLILGANAEAITARDLHSGRSFKVIESKIHSYTDLWDMFCHSFTYNTSFDRLLELCNTFGVVTSMSGEASVNTYLQKPEQNQITETPISNNIKEKIDVNNASEVELTALPGVSIVLAKKLIKKREEINGFKSVSDVCLFLHLKPHMENQLKELICVNKIKNAKKIKRYNERSVDL